MSRMRPVARLLSMAVLTLCTHVALAGNTYVVGTCRPNLPSYPTITAALVASPAPAKVQVCPGSYYEQVIIQQPVSLIGISDGVSAQPVIATFAVAIETTTTDIGAPVAPEIWVQNVPGPVNISNITVDGINSGIPGYSTIGIFYEHSSGTVNHVTTRNQTGFGNGNGIWLEGSSSPLPSITVENSSVHDFDNYGIWAFNQLTANIQGNRVNGKGGSATTGIRLDVSNDTVSGNFVVGAQTGINTGEVATGSVSNNTVMDSSFSGIFSGSDGVTVKSNKIMFSGYAGIHMMSLATIQGNSITNANVGIQLNCLNNPNVLSNAVIDADTAFSGSPAGIDSTNTYFDVGTIKTGC